MNSQSVKYQFNHQQYQYEYNQQSLQLIQKISRADVTTQNPYLHLNMKYPSEPY